MPQLGARAALLAHEPRATAGWRKSGPRRGVDHLVDLLPALVQGAPRAGDDARPPGGPARARDTSRSLRISPSSGRAGHPAGAQPAAHADHGAADRIILDARVATI